MVPVVSSKESRRRAKRQHARVFETKIGPNKLTRFERARIVGARSLQLAMGAPPFIPLEANTKDPIGIGMKELESASLPISIRRALPNGNYQDIPIKFLL